MIENQQLSDKAFVPFMPLRICAAIDHQTGAGDLSVALGT